MHVRDGSSLSHSHSHTHARSSSGDYGTYLGSIPQVPHTYNVIGNTNSEGLTIAETTFGGLKKLSIDPLCNVQYGCIDYGNLMWVTLQRAASAREAINTMDSLLQTYGEWCGVVLWCGAVLVSAFGSRSVRVWCEV